MLVCSLHLAHITLLHCCACTSHADGWIFEVPAQTSNWLSFLSSYIFYFLFPFCPLSKLSLSINLSLLLLFVTYTFFLCRRRLCSIASPWCLCRSHSLHRHKKNHLAPQPCYSPLLWSLECSCTLHLQYLFSSESGMQTWFLDYMQLKFPPLYCVCLDVLFS